ncbi:MAG: AsmA-like C-terminal region-containing protein [Bacteroidales bacterium]|nr:AsmA-like C-terminal region-containing protein [Bacteroidales bacterium]
MVTICKKRRWQKLILWLLAAVILLPVLALIGAEVFLQSRSFTSLANRIIGPYIEGEAHIGELKLSVLRSFPNARLDIDGLEIVYPHDRFAQYDQSGMHSELLESGRSDTMDTLLSARHLHAAIDYTALLKKRIVVPKLRAEGLRAHLHVYNSTASNLDIIRFSSSDDDSTAFTLPDISLKKAELGEGTYLVYTDQEDTTLARLALSVFDIVEHKGHIDLKADADALVYMPLCGRLALPIGIDGEIAYPKMADGITHITLHDFKGHIASLPMEATGDVTFHKDSTFWNLKLFSHEAPYQKVVKESGSILPQLLHDIETPALVNIDIESNGWSHKGEIMPLKVRMEVPKTKISYLDIVKNGDFDMTLEAAISPTVDIDVDIEDLCLKMKGVDATLRGAVYGVTSDDMLFDIESSCIKAQLASLCRFLPKDMGVNAHGDIDLDIEGKISMSQLTSMDFAHADLNGKLEAVGVAVSMPADTLEANLAHADIRIASMNSIESKRERAIGLSARIDTAHVTLGSSISASLKDVSAVIQSADKAIPGSKFHPLLGSLSAASARMMSSEALAAGLRNTKNTFRITPSESLPHISISSENEGLYVRSDMHRAIVKDVKLSLDAQKRSESIAAERSRLSARRKEHMDSLRRAYPDVSRDSLRRIATAGRPQRELPKYLQEREFSKKDIDIRLSGALADYFGDWKPSGSISIASGRVITPLLPLKNVISGFSGGFNEDEIEIASLGFVTGESDLAATGKMKGLRRALSSRGMLNLDIKLNSKHLNANELIAALSAGSKISLSEDDASLDDSAFEQKVVTDTLSTSSELDYSLIVIPANVNADVSIDALKVTYSNIDIDRLKLSASMRERCLQLTDGQIVTDFGTILANAFYSTQTKKDIAAGFDLKLNDVTAERVIEFIPQIDSLVPELKSFKGLMDCQIAATSQLDTNMNLRIPTLTGIVKINGKNLSIEQTGVLKKISKLLMFRDKEIGTISDMSIYGTIKDNQMEVFPFILEIDRYAVALRGIQGFDQNFDYNASLVKSPLPIKLGVDIYGNDFDHIRYRLGKSRYKSSEVPVFTSQVDTMQVNLVHSIRNIFSKGVSAAIRENEEAQKLIEQQKKALGYDQNGTYENLTLEEQLALDQSIIEMDMKKEDEELQDELDALLDDTMASISSIEAELLNMTSKLGKK